MEPKEKSIDIYCPTCNVIVESTIVGSYEPEMEIIIRGIDADPSDYHYKEIIYFLSKCPRCENPFLTEAEYYVIPGEVNAFQSSKVLFPTENKFISDRLPNSIHKSYSSAKHSYEVGLYEPAVIMCRKCLEAICIEKGEVKGNLKSRIDKLRDAEIIDKKLFNWADNLRMIGNDAAHEFEVNITQQDAADSIEFVEALLSYVFVLNKKFDEFQKRYFASKKE